MRLHSPLGGVCGPSLTCRHWGFLVSPVDFVAPQMEAPSDYYVDSRHTLVIEKHWFALACLQCFYPNVA